MRTLVVGLGIQGNKRMAVAGPDVVATADPLVPGAQYRTVEDVPLETFDRALVCTPDDAKEALLTYLLSHGKHVLVEKPLLLSDAQQLSRLQALARSHQAACYTAYNHRFEPHLVRVKELLDAGTIGSVYLTRLFYGNGTARDVKRSPWRDRGLGVLPDLGSHLLDLALFLFGPSCGPFEAWSVNRFENHAPDHVAFGSRGQPVVTCDITLLSWRNTFTLDVFGSLGSVHVHGLCKWGPSILTVRQRVLPSGRPHERVDTIESADPTWEREYRHFDKLCRSGSGNLENDAWIQTALTDIARTAEVCVAT